VDELQAEFAQRYRLFDDAVARGAALFGADWLAAFDDTLDRLFPDPVELAAAAKGYASFAMDILRRQRRFDQERAYPAKTFEEAAAEVYLDAGYMASEYLPGLLLSHFLWPHHYHQGRFFESAYVEQMRVAGGTSFVEVAAGTGMYSRRLLQLIPEASGRGFDLSPAVKAFVDHHMAAYGLNGRYRLELQDATTAVIAPTDWLVCVELLEHLEDPAGLLASLRAVLRPGGKAFITAAINAPNADHIYLYRDPQEVIDQLYGAGFGLQQAFIGPAFVPRSLGVPVPTVAAFVVS
jgi:SAM-dependent methyltransferase